MMQLYMTKKAVELAQKFKANFKFEEFANSETMAGAPKHKLVIIKEKSCPIGQLFLIIKFLKKTRQLRC
jgi:hypothetical protein